ncbi:hypothetical protein AKJ16_DCAP09170 [Drosera capensis]
MNRARKNRVSKGKPVQLKIDSGQNPNRITRRNEHNAIDRKEAMINRSMPLQAILFSPYLPAKLSYQGNYQLKVGSPKTISEYVILVLREYNSSTLFLV